MIYFQVTNQHGAIIAGNMKKFPHIEKIPENKIYNQHKGGKGIKSDYRNIGSINVWIIALDEADLLKSAKLFNKTFELYQNISLSIYEELRKEIDSYSHSLITIHAQISQKIELFAPSKNFYGPSYADVQKKIRNVVKGHIPNASELICYTQKRIIDMRAQFLEAKVIHYHEDININIEKVCLLRAILSQYSAFIEQLNDKNIETKFYIEESEMVEIDKRMFSLIMYNFFSNIVKYAKPNSTIKLNYNNNILDVLMVSIKMDNSELSELHHFRVRGKHAINNTSGKGIGLFTINKALSLMGKPQMFIKLEAQTDTHEDGVTYSKNHFRFTL